MSSTMSQFAEEKLLPAADKEPCGDSRDLFVQKIDGKTFADPYFQWVHGKIFALPNCG